jgi:hypothetical protein
MSRNSTPVLFWQDALASRHRDEFNLSDWLPRRAVHQFARLVFSRLDALHDFGCDWSAPVAPSFHQNKHRRASAAARFHLFLSLGFHHVALMAALF